VRREVPISDETRRLNRVPHLPSRTGWYSFALLDRTSLNQAAGFCVLCDSWVALPADHLAHKVPFLMEDDFVESGPFPVRWYANTVSDRPGVGTEAASLLNSTYQLSVSMAPDYLIAMLSVLVKDFPVVPTYGGFSCPSEWSAEILLGPVKKTHALYIQSMLEVAIGGDILRWFLIYHWFDRMLRRMNFGEGEGALLVAKVEKFAMAYAEIGGEMLDDDFQMLDARFRALRLIGEWDDDIPTPPWDLD
jgi:hypothetical protein